MSISSVYAFVVCRGCLANMQLIKGYQMATSFIVQMATLFTLFGLSWARFWVLPSVFYSGNLIFIFESKKHVWEGTKYAPFYKENIYINKYEKYLRIVLNFLTNIAYKTQNNQNKFY